jgi:hypothetical protein
VAATATFCAAGATASVTASTIGSAIETFERGSRTASMPPVMKMELSRGRATRRMIMAPRSRPAGGRTLTLLPRQND